MEAMTSRPGLRVLAVANAAVLLAGVMAAVVSGGDDVPAAGARVTVDGSASVVRVDGTTADLSTGDIVRRGEEVRAEEGSFTVELAAGGVVEGRAGFGRAADTRLVVDARPELTAGELLVLGDDGVAVEAAGTVVALTADDGAARVDRGLAVRAASYQGAVEVDSAGQERTVGALRQLGIASLGRPPGSAEPFLVDDADPWDRRFLGAAIDLGVRLDAYSRSFTANAPPGAVNPTTFEDALPALADEPELGAALRRERDRPPGELLVGTAIVTLASGSFGDAWDAVFGFRDEGAGWGLVAADQGLDAGTVLRTVEEAIVRAQPAPEVATGTTAPGGTAPTTATTAPPTTTGPPPTTAPPGTTSPPPTNPPPTTTPVPTLPPPTVPEILDDILGDVEDTAEEILDVPLPTVPTVPLPG